MKDESAQTYLLRYCNRTMELEN